MAKQTKTATPVTGNTGFFAQLDDVQEAQATEVEPGISPKQLATISSICIKYGLSLPVDLDTATYLEAQAYCDKLIAFDASKSPKYQQHEITNTRTSQYTQMMRGGLQPFPQKVKIPELPKNSDFLTKEEKASIVGRTILFVALEKIAPFKPGANDQATLSIRVDDFPEWGTKKISLGSRYAVEQCRRLANIDFPFEGSLMFLHEGQVSTTPVYDVNGQTFDPLIICDVVGNNDNEFPFN
jgi:hypothetical protein